MLVWSVGLASAVGVAAAANASQFPVSVYPPPVKARPRGAFKYCPSPERLARFASATRASARAAVQDYGRISLAHDLADSDRSWQAEVRAMWLGKPASRQPESTARVVDVTAATANAYSLIVRYACGGALVRHSLTVTTAPKQASGERPCQACRTTFFLIDRRGRALIYFVY